jgi:hypothetical protein
MAQIRRAGADLAGRIRAWPRRTKLIAAGGVAAVVLLASLTAMSLGGSPEANPAGASTAAQSPTPGPAFPVQQHNARGISVTVPKGWKQTGAGVWIDFTDPEDSRRKVRILVEKTGTDDPTKFLTAAGNRLKKNLSPCDRPYDQIKLTGDVQLAGQPAAELEYTCGRDDEQRHGIWRAIIQDGHAYSFFLTAQESRFAESKPIYDEMVRSFQLDPA